MPKASIFAEDARDDRSLKKRMTKHLKNFAELHHVDVQIEGTPTDILADYDKLVEAFYTYLIYVGEFNLDINRAFVGGENIVARTLITGKKILFLLRRLDFRELAKTQIEQLSEYVGKANETIDAINKTLTDLEASEQPPTIQTKAVVEKFNVDMVDINNTYNQQLRNIGILNKMRLDNLARHGGGRAELQIDCPKRFM